MLTSATLNRTNKLNKLIVINIIILIACSVSLLIRICTKRTQNRSHLFAFEIIAIVLSIINAILGIILVIFEQQRKFNLKILNIIHLIFNTICAIIFLFIFIIEFIRWWRDLLHDNGMINNARLVTIVLVVVISLCQIQHFIGNRFLIYVLSLLLIIISIASISFNGRLIRSTSVRIRPYILLQSSSCYTIVCGIVGIALTFAYRKKNSIRKCLSYFFVVLCTFGLILIMIFTIILICSHRKVHSHVYISIVQIILLLANVASLCSLVINMKRINRNGLTIERIRLSEISSNYLTYWSAAFDAFNCISAGMTGEATLQLMKAYENGQLENIECVVLRIGRLNRRVPISVNQVDNTEAIVLLTIVHHYDATVTSPLNGFWSSVLKRTLGSENCTKYFRPLVLRVGLIGFQWPFRTSLFFTAPHPEPLIRATHVLKTIIEWNQRQNSQLRCDFLVFPTLNTEPLARAIPFAGFFSLTFPPTYLLDLRPHHGKTWNEYMKTLKKGNRRPYLQQFLTKGGQIEEIHDLTKYEIGQIVCKQWENIARIRREKKQPATLAKPSIEFILSMGSAMSEPYRSVLFLRFNDEVIASSVIYKFPHKLITTDIQGLTHEKARPLKAYFVMLQWVIKEALDKKYDFVDFGATTPEPKLDLGCKSAPLAVGGYTNNPILAFAIQQSCQTLNAIHTHKSSNQTQTIQQTKQNPLFDQSCINPQFNDSTIKNISQV